MRLIARRAAPSAIVGLALTLTACSGGVGDPVDDDTAPRVVASGLDVPWSIAFHGDTPLISERDSGRVVALHDDGSTSEVTTVLDVRDEGEGGLLGIAVDDDHLYAYVTVEKENRVVRFPLSGEGTDLTAGPPRTLVDGIPAAKYHNGGWIAFGPDGMLYATTGDAQYGEDAQDLDSLAGKILRMTPDGEVPDDNPFPGSVVYSYGHRNPQGIAWASDGTMYATEFGQDTWDELNVIEPGGNYGWPAVEGIGEDGDYVDPVLQWRPADASPSGMAVLDDVVYIANLRGERVREVPIDGLDRAVERYVGEYGRFRDVVVTPDGALWAVTGNTDGSGWPEPDDDRILEIPIIRK